MEEPRRQIAREWYARVVWIQYGHYRAALHFTRLHRLLGGFTVLLTAGIGTSVFAALAKHSDWLILTGALSVVATLLSALQTFLSYGERGDKHRVSGARYGIIGRRLELLLGSEFSHDELKAIKRHLDQLAQECPHIPDRVFKKMKKDPPQPLEFEAKFSAEDAKLPAAEVARSHDAQGREPVERP